ncbi:hypothetical protein AURDEDRAFT_176127, partial [Auricularia subglabra TFB-10046 SS5]
MKRARSSGKASSSKPKPPKRPRRDENTPVHPQTADKAQKTSQERRGGTTNTAASRSASRTSTTAPTQKKGTGRNKQSRQRASGSSSPSPEPDGETAEQDADPTSDVDEEEEDATPDLNPKSSDSVDFQNWWASLSAADKDAVRTVGGQSCMFVPFDKFQQVFHYGAITEAKAKQPPAQPNAADKPAEKFTFT